MPAGGDEVQIAANAGLGRMDVAEIVRAVDDPEFFVAGGEIENLFVVGKNDERGKAELGMDGNDVFLRVLDDARPVRRGTATRKETANSTKDQRTSE